MDFNLEDNPKNYRTIEDYAPHLPLPDVDVTDRIEPEDRILLLRLSAIGDAVRILPVVEYLRNNRFSGRIDCVVEPPTDQFLTTAPGLDNTYTLPIKDHLDSMGTILSVISELRSNDYDWVFDLHGLLKSGVLSYLTAANHRIGYSREKSRELNYYFQTATPRDPLPPSMPRTLKYIQLLRPFTPDFRFTRRLIQPSFPEFEASTQQLRTEADRNPILLHPSSSHSRYGTSKEWGTDNFTRLLTNLLPRLERPVRITWGPGELEKAKTIEEAVDDPGVKASAETRNLTDLAYQLTNASLVITVDTSVAHLADLLGQPLVVIFGGSNHYIHAPLFTNYRFVSRRASEEVIEDIPVRRVQKATEDLLEESS